MIRRLVRLVDTRTGSAGLLRRALRYVFPDHWSFLFGEIALYAFMVLVATGVYLTFFYEPSLAQTTYQGSYAPLRGVRMSEAYHSVLHLSQDTRAGLLIRQTHHWAADVFLAAIVVHLMRIFFTGAFRRPRDMNWYVGLSMLGLALVEGYLGYSMIDDLLSGMGVAIGYSVALSIPVVGAWIGMLVWGGEYADDWITRFDIAHVFLLPVAIGALIGLHLLLITRPHHTQFRGRGRTEGNTVGSPLWPGYLLRSTGLLFAVAAALLLLGGLVQINPIWEWGPYETYLSTNGAQPDWYLGWLIGALRMAPSGDWVVNGVTIVPNPFWGGVLFPTVVFGVLFLWPALERRITGDRGAHHLLDRPRDRPWRTAFGAAFFTWVAITFVAGATDRVFVQMGVSYDVQIWVMRVAFLVLPVIVFILVRRLCIELRDRELHPMRRWSGHLVRRTPAGGFEEVPAGEPEGPETGP